MTYHIVQLDVDFLKEKIVVPCTWLNQNNTFCFLPPVITPEEIEKKVEDGSEPSEGWQMHSISWVKTFDTYKKAKEYHKKFKKLETSDSEQENPSSRLRKRLRPNFYGEQYISLDDDDVTVVNSPESANNDPLIVKVQPLSKRKRCSYATRNHEEPKPTPLVAPEIIANDTQSVEKMLNELHTEYLKEVDDKCACNSSCHRLMLLSLKRMRQDIEKNNMLLEMVLGQRPLPSTVNPLEVPANFPVRLPTVDVKEIDELELYLQDSTNFAQTLEYFSTMGGNDAKQTMKRIMEQLISIDLAPKLNWRGRGFKTPFSSYKKIHSLVFNAVKHNPKSEPITLSDMEKHIKDWLRFAPDRHKSITKRESWNRQLNFLNQD